MSLRRHPISIFILFHLWVPITSPFYLGNFANSASKLSHLHKCRKIKISYPPHISFENLNNHPQLSPVLRATTKHSLSKKKNNELDLSTEDAIDPIIHKYKFDWNLLKIKLMKSKNDYKYIIDSDSSSKTPKQHQFEYPIIADIYADKEMKLGIINGFKIRQNGTTGVLCATTPPLVKISLLKTISSDEVNEEIIIDLGQIITIWVPTYTERNDYSSLLKKVSNQYIKAKKSFNKDLAVNQCERAMQSLWKSHIGRGRTSSTAILTKKQINQFQNEHVQNILRKATKAGGGMSRLVTSLDAVDHLFNWDQDNSNNNDMNDIYRRIVASECLALDANLGGRFRRLSCTFVSASYANVGTTSLPTIESISLLNGGWIPSDTSVRAGEEARKFAARAIDSDKNNSTGDSTTSNPQGFDFQLKTAADERITKRLECLAMGEDLFESKDKKASDLELDVRQALSSMNLPVNPRGAGDALVQIGRWSINDEKNIKGPKIEPWSEMTLQAAKHLVNHEGKRRKALFFNSLASGGGKVSKKPLTKIENRMDLTSLPTVCVDAKSAAFRDDAIGVRPRSMTGRKVVKGASKWEILIHIIDVSDIYSPRIEPWSNPLEAKSAHELRSVAENRGLSRYDLPLGPLHLLPPVALEALSFSANKFSLRYPSKQSKKEIDQTVNRCVTLWAYIDERNGKLLDLGLERSIISNPVALTFSDASDLLDGKIEESYMNKNIDLSKSKAVLSVAERNLSLWSNYNKKTSKAARDREKRMTAKELISREIIDPIQTKSNRQRGKGDADRVFQRTRGHRTVDSALDLYGFGLDILMRKKNASIPRASGSGADRGGRLGTAPLRR